MHINEYTFAKMDAFGIPYPKWMPLRQGWRLDGSWIFPLLLPCHKEQNFDWMSILPFAKMPDFESRFRVIWRECGMENMPEQLVKEIIPLVRAHHIPLIFNALQYFDAQVMQDDAGDCADERWRLATAIQLMLTGSQEPIDEALLDVLPNVHLFSQRLICTLIRARSYAAGLDRVQAAERAMPAWYDFEEQDGEDESGEGPDATD